MKPLNTLHLLQSPRQHASKSTRHSGRTKEHSVPQRLFIPSIPKREQINHAGEKPTFSNTEEEPCGEEAGSVGDGGHGHHNPAPGHHDEGDPAAGPG